MECGRGRNHSAHRSRVSKPCALAGAYGTGSVNIGVEGFTGLTGYANYSGSFHDGDFRVWNPQSPETDGVQLPTDAIDDDETLDEPGISQNVNSNLLVLNSAAMTDIVTTTITIPDAGYIVIEASTTLQIAGITEGHGWSLVQIDETAGGTYLPGYTIVGAEVLPNLLEAQH